MAMSSFLNASEEAVSGKPNRQSRSTAANRTETPPRCDFSLEPLENRLLLSVDIVGAGIPTWTDQGPGPIINTSQTPAPPDNRVGGAVQSVAVDPNNSANIWIGTTNGGVWHTTNADPANPGAITWTPTMDQMPSLAIGAVTVDPTDASGNTVWAGTGSFSNGFEGGDAIGLYRTTDGGATWQLLGTEMAGFRVKEVLPTTVITGTGQLILVATTDGGGLFRSVDGGASFTQGATGLPPGSVSSLIVDPNNPSTFFAAVPGQGIFRSTDGAGATWTQVTTGIPAAALTGSSTIELTAHGAGGTVLFAGVASGSTLNGVFTSTDNGGNWTPLAAGPTGFDAGGGFNEPFSIVADPVASNIVYLGSELGTGLFRYDPTGSGSWVQINGTGNALNNTSPHADSHDMAFLNNTTLIDADDGGIYYLTNATNANTDGWRAFVGNVGAVEFFDTAYDTNANLIFGGAQDNGSSIQSATNNTVWTQFFGGDGQGQAYDALGNVRYALSNNFAFFLHNGTSLLLGADATDHAIAGATNAGPIVITSNNHGLTTGDGVFIRNVGGNTAANGIFVVTVIDPNTFSLNGSTGNGAYTAGTGTWREVGLNANDLAFTVSGNFNAFLPLETNPFSANAVMFGRASVYESSNQGDVITDLVAAGNLLGFSGFARSIAYGGSRAGTDFANVAYVGTSSGQLWVRGETGAAFTLLSGAGAGQLPTGQSIVDIAADPQDWRRVYVIRGTQVWMSNNVTDLANNPFTNITGNLAGNPGDLTTQLRSITLFDDTTTTAGDSIPLVGGLGGAFRLLGSTWTEYGASLPNVVVEALDYIPGNDTLIAGTFGRGAWSIANVSTTIESQGVLQITGDDDFAGEDDVIRLELDASNPTLLNVFLNSTTPTNTYQLSTLQQINVDGLGGHDTLIVDSSNGLITVPLGIRYDGGTGTNDQLQLLQTGGPTRSSDIYDIGSTNGSGTSTISDATGTQVVSFENLAPVLDLVPAGSLTVNATASDNAISYTSGALATEGLVSVDEHEPITFSNKGVLVIDAGGGQDTISLDNPSTPDGLTAILIDGGDPTAGDRVIVTGTGGDVTVGPGFFGTLISGPGVTAPIALFGIESLDLGGIGNLTLNTTAADDTLTVTPGDTTVTGITTGSLQSNALLSQITFANSGSVTADLDGGNDAVVVNGSSTADTVAVSGTEVDISGRSTVTYSNAEALTVNGNAGSDIFNVTPAAAVSIFIDGGDPVGAQPGDQLNILAGGAGVTFNAGPHVDEGSFVVGSDQPVSFAHIESFGITGSGPATINGTNGPDTITVIARDSSYAAGLDGVRDFTVSVNTGPDLLFSDVASLTINALSGSDQITLRTPAPNNAIWNVAVSVDGGPPAADTDRVIVETPGPGAETVLYTPSAADGGLLNLTSLSSPVTLTGVEVLSYDGQNDNDSLTVAGTGIDDTIIHTPGANDQAGSFQVDALLPLSYQNLGGAGSLTVDGGGGTDTLVYNGTAADDLFTVGSAGQVTLNSRLPVGTTSVETLTLQGLQGYDTVSLTGTAGPDSIDITGQAVRINGGMTINANVEDIRLDALGDNDVITYNGVSGVSENIRVSSSGLAGGGQISVPGVTLIDFSGVERIDVNGNVPGSTETDTLTFAGTNAADTFNIHLAAAGTDTDPILQLQNGSGATLLTLRKYTNFNTLNVQGLDGTDNFNVYTAATGPSRNVFIDGGAPTGKKKSTDNLNVFYASPKPRIIHSAATQDPDAGLVDLAYGTARFVVQYDDIEQVVIRKS
jgi:hypothetical protein